MSERVLVSRSDVKAFYGVPTDGLPIFTRMRGFTEISESKNPKEYTRQYVDQEFETTDVIGYAPSLSFGFDKYTGDAVLTDMADIIDNELTGTAAHRCIIHVDFTKEVEGGGYAARKRTFAVIGDSVGSGLDALAYSGTLRAVSETVEGVATIVEPPGGDSNNVETIGFVEN